MGDLFVFQLFSPLSEESENKREEDEEEKLLFQRFTPAGPVYAFLANLYSGLADVGRRLLCAVLFPAFLCLSAPPLRTCSLAIVCLCAAAWRPVWHQACQGGVWGRMRNDAGCQGGIATWTVSHFGTVLTLRSGF